MTYRHLKQNCQTKYILRGVSYMLKRRLILYLRIYYGCVSFNWFHLQRVLKKFILKYSNYYVRHRIFIFNKKIKLNLYAID